MDDHIELRHLRYFVAVAEELHFGRAAIRLDMAQPPLSQQIQRLEALIGHALFIRTSRSVRLTPAGMTLLERAQRTLQVVQVDVDEVRRVGRGEVGLLQVGFVGSAILTTLPAIFHRYLTLFPGVELKLHESFTAPVMEGVLQGRLDVGIVRDPDPAEALWVRPLFSEPFVAVLSIHHPRAHQAALSVADLRNEQFIHYPRSAGERAWGKPLSLCERHGFRPQVAQEAAHWLTILSLVGAGLGVCIAPACVARLAPPEVACLPLPDEQLTSDIGLMCRAGETRPIVEGFARVALGSTPS